MSGHGVEVTVWPRPKPPHRYDTDTVQTDRTSRDHISPECVDEDVRVQNMPTPGCSMKIWTNIRRPDILVGERSVESLA